jgi:hypothetical protein
MRKILVLASAMAFSCPGLAYAVNNTINTATPAALGHVQEQAMNNTDIAYYGFLPRAGRSYAAACWMPSAEGSVGPGFISFRCSPTIRDNADAVVTVTDLTSTAQEPSVANGHILTFIPSLSNTFFFRVVAQGTGTMRIVIFETTLFAPWYFINTTSGYEAFVEIKNNTPITISVTVSVFTASGAAAGTGTTTVSIPGNGNTALPVGTTFGITSGSGGLQVASTAAPGGVTANVTTLSGTTGLSFDSPAAPRMVWSLFP